jgi:hypothetical protein
MVAPFGLLSGWHWSASIALLHLASVLAVLVGAASIFGLMVHGTPTAVALGQALSPLPLVFLAALLLAAPLSPVRAGAAAMVALAVTAAIGDAFGTLGRRRAVLAVLGGAFATALVAVLTKALSNHGVGLVETYVVRTAGAAAVALALAPPRAIPARALPGLAIRSASVTSFWLLSIAAIERGDPAVVQAAVAASPLMLATGGAVRARRWPPRRLIAAVVLVPVGVGLLTRG